MKLMKMTEKVKLTDEELDISYHACNICGKRFEDYDFLCSDDICVECHGGLENFAECHMRHFFLMATQCFNLMFKSKIKNDEDYNNNIERITKQSMVKVREIINFTRKYDDSKQNIGDEE